MGTRNRERRRRDAALRAQMIPEIINFCTIARMQMSGMRGEALALEHMQYALRRLEQERYRVVAKFFNEIRAAIGGAKVTGDCGAVTYVIRAMFPGSIVALEKDPHAKARMINAQTKVPRNREDRRNAEALSPPTQIASQTSRFKNYR